MKRTVVLLLLLATWMFTGKGTAQAVGIDMYATVNPNYQDSWDPDTLSGRALYTLHVDRASQYGANVFCVTFEKDIFASVGTAANNSAELSTPYGWTLVHAENPNGLYEYQVAKGGLDLLEGDETIPVSFWVDYTLSSRDRYYSASGPGWSWNEGDAWSQAVSATNTLESLDPWLGGGNPSGGTSTYPNPEPATMLLLGSGLIGLGVFGRKRLKKLGS